MELILLLIGAVVLAGALFALSPMRRGSAHFVDKDADGGTLTIATANVSRHAPERAEEPAAGDYVAVSVSDTGTGMSEAVLARAFEPFFTTKEIGKGSGLGLAQVFGFAKQSGGGVRIDSTPGVGTTVSVFLPRAAALVEPVKQRVLDMIRGDGDSWSARTLRLIARFRKSVHQTSKVL